MEIINGIIKSASIDDGERGILTAWLHIDHSNGSQGFGGYVLYLPESYKNSTHQVNFAGHFLFRCMEIADVSKWNDLVGKIIRLKQEHNKIHAIGHIIKNKWFDPAAEFEAMTSLTPKN